MRHLPTVESEFGSCLPAEADAEVSKMMEDELAMMRARAYASHPTIQEMHDKMAKLTRCAKHVT